MVNGMERIRKGITGGGDHKMTQNLRSDIFIMFTAMMVSENILAWYSSNVYSFCHNKYVF